MNNAPAPCAAGSVHPDVTSRTCYRHDSTTICLIAPFVPESWWMDRCVCVRACVGKGVRKGKEAERERLSGKKWEQYLRWPLSATHLEYSALTMYTAVIVQRTCDTIAVTHDVSFYNATRLMHDGSIIPIIFIARSVNVKCHRIFLYELSIN